HRHRVPRPAEPSRPLADLTGRLLLGDARRVPPGRGLDGGLRRLAVRRQRARHARSAPAHERARLPRLDDPLPLVPVLGLLERRGGASLPPLQPPPGAPPGGAPPPPPRAPSPGTPAPPAASA